MAFDLTIVGASERIGDCAGASGPTNAALWTRSERAICLICARRLCELLVALHKLAQVGPAHAGLGDHSCTIAKAREVPHVLTVAAGPEASPSHFRWWRLAVRSGCP